MRRYVLEKALNNILYITKHYDVATIECPFLFYLASMRGISSLNKHIFNNTHIQIIPVVHELPCNEDIILSDYLDIIEKYDPNILGFIGTYHYLLTFETILNETHFQ